MTYATQQDLIDRFGEQELIQLTDRATPATEAINATVVGKALADSDAEINAYLGARYTLPFASVPSVIVRIAGDIARYYLYEDRVTEAVRQRYEDAVKFLKSVAKGEVSLGVDGAQAPPAPVQTVQFTPGQKVFGREALD